MHIAITGATGFLGRYIVNHFLSLGHHCRCWYRPQSDRGGFSDSSPLTWVRGELQNFDSIANLLEGADAVVHGGLYQPPSGSGHRGASSDVTAFAQVNIMGSLQLIESAQRRGIERFVFISSGGVHDQILEDRPLDERHPLWPQSHYGAYKASVEKFVHSFGLSHRFSPGASPTHRHLTDQAAWAICSLRPVGIYGLRRPLTKSKWHDVVRKVQSGNPIADPSGGKEVHADDIACAVELLLNSDPQVVAGQSYNCCDRYIAAEEVATIAKDLCGSNSEITRSNKGPKHQIETGKLEALGMQFGGRLRLERYVEQLIAAIAGSDT